MTNYIAARYAETMGKSISQTLVKTSLLILGLLLYSFSHTQTITASSLKNVPKTVDFKVMPYASYNRNLNFMAGLIPMISKKLDKGDHFSPKTLSGVAGI